jgi:hypothetical protein
MMSGDRVLETHPTHVRSARRRLSGIVLVMSMAVTLAAPATAAPLILRYSGAFGPPSTLDGVALGASTEFTFEALFDSTTDFSIGLEGVGMFEPSSVTFTIAGFGSFTVDPLADLDVVLFDLDADGVGPGFAGGLMSGGLGFFAQFDTATPPFDADAPTPSVLSDLFQITTELEMVIPFVGGRTLVIEDFDFDRGAEVELLAVPEPATLTSFGIAALGLACNLWRSRRQLSTKHRRQAM